MSVTYTCPHCSANLRTANPVKPGRVVPCPKCKETFTPVPLEETEAEVAPAKAIFKLADELPPSKKPAARKPEADPPQPPAKKPTDDDDEEDGDSVRKGYGVQVESEEEIAKIEANKPKFGEVRDKFKRSKRGPAAAMLVQPANLLTFEGFLTSASGIGLFIYGMWPIVFNEAPAGDEEKEEAIFMMLSGGMVFIWGAIICVGASMMQNLQSYTMAMVGAVMGILPLLAGVFALAVLRNPKVIAGFEEVEVDDDEADEEEESEDEDDDDDDEDEDDDDEDF